MSELLPTRATFAPGEPIEIELRPAPTAPLQVSLWHLDERVANLEVDAGEAIASFPPQPEGGYGVETAGARSAFDVLADPLSRPRYGFVCDFTPGRKIDGVSDNVRRLHLNAIQFYDWMYRHAQLLPPTDEFDDPLGRRLSLDTVRRLVAEVAETGSLPLGYASVYAAGSDEWPAWQDQGLYRSDGTPWTLGNDFLWNIDPSSERWLTHLAGELHRAQEDIGFAGFHLDQYGAPKRALRQDGSQVDLAAAFPALISRLADQLPEARLIFNNVNDFPTWTTASARQDAIYIEVWPPHDRLHHLAQLAAKAHALAPAKPVILAAYLSAYTDDQIAASAAERLELATAYSHGASVLLHGEEDAVLTEAYYVRHQRLDPTSLEATRCGYDFVVRYGDLLFDKDNVDVTRSELGGVNQELSVQAPVPITTEAEAGALWARAIRGKHGLLVSLINLSAQHEDRWDAGMVPSRPLQGVRVAAQRVQREAPTFLYADPDHSPAMQQLATTKERRHDSATLPPFSSWALLWVREQEQR